MKSKLNRQKGEVSILGEDPAFRESANELASRGFDAIVFGHTHHAGHSILPNGADYYNTGSWLMGTPYLEINDGQLNMRYWSRVAPKQAV
jgi:UDP-2,3-diacylglucosamine pyrophosphatase LpxH